MTDTKRQLLVLGCSQVKRTCDGLLPAIDRYDGPHYRVLRGYLRDRCWPENLSVAVLSAKHGLFGGLKSIEYYDLRMDRDIAKGTAAESSATLRQWASDHQTIWLSLGKDYLPAVQPALETIGERAKVFDGPIGMKLHQVKSLLDNSPSEPRRRVEVEAGTGRAKYFLPDWDDLLDPGFDFEADSFSGPTPAQRGDRHCCVLMQPRRMCDGMLVSLAQAGTSKGPLRRLEGTEDQALSPIRLRSHFGLAPGQWLFGDCGAFSYVNEDRPTLSVRQAVSMYELYGFDFGASVDHMPVAAIVRDGERRFLSMKERRERVRITRDNAELFIQAALERKANFNPVGTIQALKPSEFAKAVKDYYAMGYRHLAIGGLVPLSDAEIDRIVTAVSRAAGKLPERPWIHLFGVFRPKLQQRFRTLKIDSFDSATYFRKAWLRSDQNYCSANGKWYAAIRVPMTSDGRTKKRLESAESDLEQLQREEREVLDLLSRYDKDEAALEEVLDAVVTYDQRLCRAEDYRSMREQYRQTLADRPWKQCDCAFCREAGIHTLIFRGANRNKRRGAHNTLMLYQGLGGSDDLD